MKTPRRFVLSRLSRKLYEEFLAEAKASQFAFVLFGDFLPGRPEIPPKYIALRHEIDFAPKYSVEMAELEHAAGVASTFFVVVECHSYDLWDRDTVEQIRRI